MISESNNERSTILIVDDTPANISVLLAFLENKEFDILIAEDGVNALETIKYSSPDLILLDIMMPKMDGFETCKHLKSNPETEKIPILFMTALSETQDKVRGLELGAVDFITKPFQNEEVLARIRTHISLKKAQKALLDKELEVRTIQAMDESRKDFLELITGELKSPLMTIYGNTKLLEETELSKDQAESVQSIMAASERIEKFTIGILEFLKESSNLDRMKQTRIHFEPLIRFVANSNKVDADKKHIKIVTECHPMVPDSLSGNPVIFRKIIDELVKNAIQFTFSGTVTISVSFLANIPQRTAEAQKKCKIAIKVKDGGPGIPEDKQKLIFSPFYQINPNEDNQGIGLGLSLTKKLCKMIDADISVISEKDKGSEFTIVAEIPEK